MSSWSFILIIIFLSMYNRSGSGDITSPSFAVKLYHKMNNFTYEFYDNFENLTLMFSVFFTNN